jgi:hypothetical protein
MNDWNALARALSDLHAALLRRARTDHAREHGITEEIGPGELLMLVTREESFAWLRVLFELMTDIDYLRDDPATAQGPELRSAVRGAVEELFVAGSGNAAAGAFGARYWQYVQEDPAVAMAHGAVRQAIAAWPQPEGRGRGDLTQHRQRVATPRRS